MLFVGIYLAIENNAPIEISALTRRERRDRPIETEKNKALVPTQSSLDKYVNLPNRSLSGGAALSSGDM